jgi:hypothetical protein
MVGPDDIAEGDVDPPERATCHHGCGRQLCYVGPEGKVNRYFGSRGLEREASMRASRTETLKPEVPKSQKLQDREATMDFSRWFLCRRGPLIHPFSRVR